MTLTECTILFCFSVAPTSPMHLSIVSRQALWATYETMGANLPFWIDLLPIPCLWFSLNAGYLFSWTWLLCTPHFALHCHAVKNDLAKSCSEWWLWKKLSTLFRNLLCPTCHKYSEWSSACLALLVLLWFDRAQCSHSGHLILETIGAQAYYIFSAALVLHDMGLNERAQCVVVGRCRGM